MMENAVVNVTLKSTTDIAITTPVVDVNSSEINHSPKGYTIKYPSTTHDDGDPSDDLMNDCRRIFCFIEDERYLTGQKLQLSIKERLDAHPGNPKSHNTSLKGTKHGLLRRKKGSKQQKIADEEFTKISEYLDARIQLLETLEKKAGIFERAMKELNKNDDWTFSQTLFGITTYYRRESDGSLSLKMEGKMEGVPLFEQVAVLREVDLHQTWAPFCPSSKTIKEIDKLDTVGWFVVGVPQLGLARDSCFRAMGCDNIAEDGNLLVFGQGIGDRPDDVAYLEPYLMEGLEGIELPEKPTRLGSGRMTLRQFSGIVNVLSATSYETKVVANVNPHLPLPQSMLDFVTRKICGFIIYKIQVAAKKAVKDPIRNPHARRIREAEDFYKGWLLPKFEAFCERRNWEMPKVDSLHLTDEDLEKEFQYVQSMSRHEKYSSRSSGPVDDFSEDTVSHITVGTIAPFSVSQYLHDIHTRADQKKADEIAAARHRVAEKLKPRQLSAEQVDRLKLLKEAKARRNRNRGLPGTILEVESMARRPTKKMSVAAMLHNHSRTTRFLITTVLSVILAIALNPNIVMHDLLESLEEESDSSWLSEAILDVSTLAYIGFLSIIHAIVCGVSMIYAFGALDLGAKTGKKSRQHYDKTVEYVTIGLSASIAFFSTSRAFLSLTMRATVWYSILAYENLSSLLAHVLDFLDHYIPSTLLSFPSQTLSVASESLGFLIHHIWRVVHLLSWLLYVVFIHSNRIGQLLETVVGFVWQSVPSFYYDYIEYIDHVRGIYEDTDVVPTWRSDAIELSRWLFSYTAVFLVSILVLFNASSRANKKYIEKWNSLSTSGLPESKSPEKNRQGSLSRDGPPLSESMLLNSASDVNDDYSVSVTSMTPEGSDAKQHRFKLRLRKKQQRNGERNGVASESASGRVQR